MKQILTVLVACATALCSVNNASASILLSYGNFITSPVPTDVRANHAENDTKAFFFTEKLLYPVGPAGVAVNLSAPGTAKNSNSFNPSPATVGANQKVNSYFVHMDRVTETNHTYGVFTIDFVGEKVIGVIFKPALFASSSFLERTGTRYPANGGGAFEGSNTFFTLNADGHSISFSAQVASGQDDIRILTVPEPASFTLMLSGLGIAAVASLKRRKLV